MAVDVANVEIGEGDLGIKVGDEMAFTDVGGCRNASLKVETEDKDVEVGQFIDPIGSFDVARMIEFTIELVEDTMRNMVIAFGGDPAEITDAGGDLVYDFPANSVQGATFMALEYSVKQVLDSAKVKKVELFKCKPVGGVEVQFNKKNEKVYPVTFKAYADPDASVSGSPGKITYEGKGTPV
ncbi:MAG: hypothetical protein KC483_09180 [Nitrosarchaeum sp.]|nr:hypothetical protein [Nitrosarchaeum sp.]